MSYPPLLEQVFAILNRAVQKDHQNDYEAALSCYNQLIHASHTVTRSNPEFELNQFLQFITKKYLTRIETIKKHLKLPSTPITLCPKPTPILPNSYIKISRPKTPWGRSRPSKEQIQAILEVMLPMKFPQLLRGRTPAGHLILYGPDQFQMVEMVKSGCMEAGAVMVEICVAGAIQGMDDDRWVVEAFRVARSYLPAVVVVIKGVDLLVDGPGGACSRDVFKQMVNQLQGSGNGRVSVVGIVQNIIQVNPFLLRLFQKRVYVPPPDDEARVEIWRELLEIIPNSVNDEDILKLVNMTERWTMSDITSLIKKAQIYYMGKQRSAKFWKSKIGEDGKERLVPSAEDCTANQKFKFSEIPSAKIQTLQITFEDLNSVIKKTQSSLTQELIQSYTEFQGFY